MKTIACLLTVALACCASGAAKPKPAPKPAAKPAAKQAAKQTAARKPATGWAARAERMAMAVMPQEKFNEAAGFFAPVAKRHLPTFGRFCREYEAAAEKLPVVAKYMPAAEQAVSEARAMKVPPRFEAKKAEYLQMIDAFMAVLRMTLKVAGQPAGVPPKRQD